MYDSICLYIYEFTSLTSLYNFIQFFSRINNCMQEMFPTYNSHATYIGNYSYNNDISTVCLLFYSFLYFL